MITSYQFVQKHWFRNNKTVFRSKTLNHWIVESLIDLTLNRSLKLFFMKEISGYGCIQNHILVYYFYYFCHITIWQKVVCRSKFNLSLWASHWIIYLNDSFTTLIDSRRKQATGFMSKSLNHSLKWFVHTSNSFMNETSDLLNSKPCTSMLLLLILP